MVACSLSTTKDQGKISAMKAESDDGQPERTDWRMIGEYDMVHAGTYTADMLYRSCQVNKFSGWNDSIKLIWLRLPLFFVTYDLPHLLLKSNGTRSRLPKTETSLALGASPYLAAMPPRESLDAHDIYLEKEETIESLAACPEELQELFKLILNVRDLKSEYFGGYETTDLDPSLVKFNPRQQYEKELKNEATLLSADCSDRRRSDDIENKWVQILEPVVFYRFDREQEERYKRDRHQHWRVAPRNLGRLKQTNFPRLVLYVGNTIQSRVGP